jgi:hypothetical protein
MLKPFFSLVVFVFLLFGINFSSFAENTKSVPSEPNPATVKAQPSASNPNNTININPQSPNAPSQQTPGAQTPVTVNPQTPTAQTPVTASPNRGFLQSSWAAILLVIIIVALIIGYNYEPRPKHR